MQKIIQERFEEHLAVANAVMQSDILAQVERVANAIKAALANGKKVLFCGNGGSAADSQHLAAVIPTQYIPLAFANSTAASTLGLVPLVEIPTSTSPSLPKAST